jgi:hypothetical protein
MKLNIRIIRPVDQAIGSILAVQMFRLNHAYLHL